ncbi:MAG: hypothetical protein ACKOPM_08690 [Novosphingobium sp.]
MKLDIGAIWNEATELVRANKEVLAALAGVFFLLPSFAFSLLMPGPQPQPGDSPERMYAMMTDFYGQAAPWLLAMVLVQALGQLAGFALLARSGRITVGEALREGLSSMLPYLGTQLIFGLAMALVFAVVVGIGAGSGMVGVAVLLGLIAAIGLIYVSLRLAMILPVIAIERVRNPIAVFKRSWDLTEGNAGRILLFMLLLFVAFIVAAIVVGIVTGVIAGLFGGTRAVELAGAATSSILGAGFTVYVIAAVAAMHRRLSGGSQDQHAETFG